MIKVSVIIPVYNAERYLGDCLGSLFLQTLPKDEIELIAVNDGSVDGSLSLLDALAEKHPNLRVISKENGGAASARNAGLDIAAGEYVGFVDSDDWVEPDMYEVMYRSAKDCDADIVFCNIVKNESENMPAYLDTQAYSEQDMKKHIYPRLISAAPSDGSTLRGAVWCRIFKRSLIEAEGIRFQEDLIYNEDGLFTIQATLAAKMYVYLGESYLYHNRVNSGSITKRYIPDLWLRQRKMLPMLSQVVSNSEYPFGEQIRRKALNIAEYSIENEVKQKNRNGLRHRLRAIRFIMSDELLQETIGKLDKNSLKKIDRGYLISIRLKLPLLALIIAKHRYRNNRYF